MSFNLIGDNCTIQAEIEKWYIDEANYHNRFKGGRVKEYNLYNDLENTLIFWNKFLQGGKFLDFGCAEGLMLQRFLRKREIKLDYYGVEVSEELLNVAKKNVPIGRYYLRKDNSKLPFEDNFFDYVAAISVLHHIPNVRNILGELKRILKSGGFLFLKDPITDMKKIDGSRSGLSPHERGIPLEYYLEYAKNNNFIARKIQYLRFGPMNKIREFISKGSIIYFLLVNSDFLMSNLFAFNEHYVRRRILTKVAPIAGAIVFEKK